MCAEVTVVEITAAEMDGQTVPMQDCPGVTAAARWTWRTPAGRCGVHSARNATGCGWCRTGVAGDWTA
jgi:hypothetical protein